MHPLAALEALMARGLDLLFVEVLYLEAVLQASSLGLLGEWLHRQLGTALGSLAYRIGSLRLGPVAFLKLLTIIVHKICLAHLRYRNFYLSLRILCDVGSFALWLIL